MIKKRVTEYLDSVWFPAHLKSLFEKESTQKLWDIAVESEDPTDRYTILSLISKKAISGYKEEKEELMRPIEAQRDSLLTVFAEEFGKARKMNDASGRLLESHYEVKSSYYSLLPEGKAEHLDSLIHSSLGKLDAKIQKLNTGITIVKDAAATLKDSLINTKNSNLQ